MARLLRFAGCWIVVLSLAFAVQSESGEARYIRQHYNKVEHQIPMRDGVRLFTSVYVPKQKRQANPIILSRTPYDVAPYGSDQFIDNPGMQHSAYFHQNYIVAYQDVRGRYMSEGEFADVRPYIPVKNGSRDIDETTDTYDTVEWLVKNIPSNNGRVGISGISYPGFYTSMGMIDAHPAVKAASPQAPVSKWMGGDDFWHNGAFLLSHAFDFYSSFGWPRPVPKSEPDRGFDHMTPDGYKFFLEMGPLPNANEKYLKGEVLFWNEIMRHGTWDSFWDERNILPHLKNIKPAVLVVGGWFDTENLFGALHTYQAIRLQSPGTRNTLVMGPWSHGQWRGNDGRTLGDIDFGSGTANYYTEKIEVPFFNYYLKDQGKPDTAGAHVFETGANQWHTLDSWPPRDLQMKNLFLQSNGTLTWDPPAGSASGSEFREYTSDPSKPVPYTSKIGHWYDPGFMVEDQRFASTRPDVLVYQSEPLKESITVAGPIEVNFFVSTSGTDSDWVVKFIDVFPGNTPDPAPNPRTARLGGYQMMVRGDVLRGKFRNSLAAPEPFVPGQTTEISFELQDVFHTFRTGHRIMVQVQSTWFPMIDLNPQKYVDIYHAQPGDFQKATQRIFSSRTNPSQIRLGIQQK